MFQEEAFAGLPDAAQFVWVWGKAPKYSGWNKPKSLFTKEQIKQGVMPSHGNIDPPTGFGMVSGRWSGTMVVDFDTNPARPDDSEATFRTTTGRSSDELPVSATVVSGRPGRRRVILTVHKDYWPLLAGYSAKLHDLELRWEGGDHNHPVPLQSVIYGPHPDSVEWAFRWAEGLSPADVGIAEAPRWLTAAMIKHRGVEVGMASMESIHGPMPDAGEPKTGYCDQLSPALTRKLLRMFSNYWPYRGGDAGSRYQASWDYDSFSALLGALHNVLGTHMAEEWLHDTPWFKRNEDWGSTHDFKVSLASVGKSNTGKKAGWGTLHYLATRTEDKRGNKFPEPPCKLPDWALPPKEIDVLDRAGEAAKKVVSLKRALDEIDRMESPTQRLVALQDLGKTLDVNEKELSFLVQTLTNEQHTQPAGAWNALLSAAEPTPIAIERLLASDCLTLLGAESGVGKSTLLYRLAEAVANGNKFLGQLETVKGNVLIIQKDESLANLAAKNALMDIQFPEDNVRLHFEFHQGMFPELRKWIKEYNAKYVLMDSMVSLFGGGNDMTESEIGTYMYLLNAMAAEYHCAIVLTHHLRKSLKKREDISMSDLYGSAFISAGTSDVWGLIRDPSKENEDEEHFLLKILKPRSGVSQGGDTFRLEGSSEDYSFTLTSINGDESGASALRGSSARVLKLLKNRGEDTAVSINEISAGASVGVRTVRRVMGELWKDKNLKIRRCSGSSAGGRPQYRYWAER